jgi:hypothetical protein
MSVLETDTGPRPQGTNINLSFGYHAGYPGNAAHFHYGTDLRAADGEPITFPENLTPGGLFILAGSFGGYGNAAVIRWIDTAGTRWYLLCGHMLRIFYNVGDWIEPGAQIGEADHTGFVDPPGPWGAHLHFGVGRESYYGSGWEDPIPWLVKYTAPREPTEEEQLEMTFTPTELENLHLAATADYTAAASLARRVSTLMNFIDLDYPEIHRIADEDTIHWILAFKGFLSPVGFAARDALFDSAHDPGTENNHIAVGIDALKELFVLLQLTREQIAALPVPKYATIKKWLTDVHEHFQEEPSGPATAGGITPPVPAPP